MKTILKKALQLDSKTKIQPWEDSKDSDLKKIETTEYDLIENAIKANGLPVEDFIKQALWWYSKRIYKPITKTSEQKTSDKAIEGATKLYIEAYGKPRFPTIAKSNGFNYFTVLRWAYINMKESLTPKQISAVEERLLRR